MHVENDDDTRSRLWSSIPQWRQEIIKIIEANVRRTVEQLKENPGSHTPDGLLGLDRSQMLQFLNLELESMKELEGA